jgi:uncharacterized protein (DUF1501 family)
MLHPTRRGFLQGCLITTAAAGVPRSVLATSSDQPDVLVLVFLRGGTDGLNLVPPIAGNDRTRYDAARPRLGVPADGASAALPLTDGFGLHPSAEPLLPLWSAGRLAVVHATGMHDPTRSHFEAQDFMELGTPGSKRIGSGWLHRHLLTAPSLPAEMMVPSLAAGFMQPTSLLGSRETLTVDDTGFFTIATGPEPWNDAQSATLRPLYDASSSSVGLAGQQSLAAIDIVDAHLASDRTPAGGAVYPEDELGRQLAMVAKAITAELGTQVVTIDVGGWDTHEQQGNGAGGLFAGLVASLSAGLNALLTDLDAAGHGERVTVVTQTEFGRRVTENANAGTDHGHAAPMLILGNRVRGGLHGPWPGLEPGDLFEGIDLEVATDYRQVLSEVVIRRLANPYLGEIFPGLSSYAPLGVVDGTDLDPIWESRPGRRIAGRGGRG